MSKSTSKGVVEEKTSWVFIIFSVVVTALLTLLLQPKLHILWGE